MFSSVMIIWLLNVPLWKPIVAHDGRKMFDSESNQIPVRVTISSFIYILASDSS